MPGLTRTTLFRKVTPDDWSPTREDGTIRIAAYIYSDGMYRIGVWGDDDLGMELDTFDGAKHANILKFIQNAAFVSISMLKSWGFRFA